MLVQAFCNLSMLLACQYIAFLDTFSRGAFFIYINSVLELACWTEWNQLLDTTWYIGLVKYGLITCAANSNTQWFTSAMRLKELHVFIHA